MTYQIRRSAERGFFDHGWLKTYHTFSFASYFDPHFMGFRDLRVINEDRVEPGHGFPSHSHRDMEIVSLVLEGELAHQDSTGTKSLLQANDVQAMSAGTGVTHSEYNPSETDRVHFLQIWILPDTQGLSPRYQQMKLPTIKDEWLLLASKGGQALKIEQDVAIYVAALDKGKEIARTVASERYGWLQIMEGKLQLNEDLLLAGDGVAFQPNSHIELKALDNARALFFDLK
jgi:quercetin 2,3-dioxygenase